jgi:two-component system NarL family sensor kinase
MIIPGFQIKGSRYAIIRLAFSILLLLVLLYQTNGQKLNVDSLLQVVANQPDNVAKADNLNELAKYYANSNIDSVRKYGEYTYRVASGINYGKAMSQADLFVGAYYSSKKNYKQSYYHFLRAFQVADSINDMYYSARAALNTATSLKELARRDDARFFFKISLGKFMVLNDSMGLIAICNNLGIGFMDASEYDSAAYYLNKGLLMSEKTQKKFYLGNICNNLSEVYKELEQYDNARKFSLRGKEYYETTGNIRGQATSVQMLGNIESDIGNYQDALAFYNQAGELFSQVNDSLHLFDILNNIGVLYDRMNNYDEANKYYARALEGYNKLNYQKGKIVVLGNQATVLQETGRSREAISLNDSVIMLANLYDFGDYRKDALDNNATNYLDLRNYPKAYEYKVRYYDLKDSIFNLDKEKLINDLNFRYENEKSQAEILALEKDNLKKDLDLKKRTIQRNAFLFGIITIIILAVFFILYILQRRKKDRIISIQKIHQLEEEKKLLAARSIVEGQEEERKRIAQDLHDGLGVLLSATKMQFTAIRDANPESRPLLDRATQLLEQASTDVRKISHNMMPGLLMKLGLYEALSDLIENINDTENLDARCVIPEEIIRLPENQEIMVYRIIQEMVNNSLKHANASNIRLLVTPLENQLEFHFSDDGKGFDVDEALQSNTMGLKSIRSRVDFLNGSITINSEPGKGTHYIIRIPMII